MKTIPKKQRVEMAASGEYSVCSLIDHGPCDGRITWEHALIFGGNKIQKKWAIIPLCELHHAVNKHQDAGTLKKELSVWVALNRATDEELRAVSKTINYTRLRGVLNEKYGVYVPAVIKAVLNY